MLNVAVEHGAVTAVNGFAGLLADGAELVGHDLVALCDAEFCYEIRVAVIVRCSRLVDTLNFLPHWRPKLEHIARR